MRRWLLWRLLLWADALICGLPSPEKPEGAYFREWGALGAVHGAIGRAYGEVNDAGQV